MEFSVPWEVMMMVVYGWIGGFALMEDSEIITQINTEIVSKNQRIFN